MAEYAKLGTALEPSLNLRQGAFMAMHQGIKLESHPTAIDSSPIGTAILQLMENRQVWQGLVSELYTDEVNNQIPTLVEADIFGALIEKFLNPSINLSPKPVLDADGNVKLPALFLWR